MQETSERNWLQSRHRDMVEVSVNNLGQAAIHEALKSLSQNFSPEECADIILGQFRKIVEDPNTRMDITSWVKAVQSTNNF